MIHFGEIVVIKRQLFSLLPEANTTFSGWLSNWLAVASVGGCQNFWFWVVSLMTW